MTIVEQLQAIADSKASLGYLAHFKADLHQHDRYQLDGSKAGQRYLWILRECGTALFPVAIGHDPVWATYWLHQGNQSDVPSLAYLVSVSGDGAVAGEVKPVTYTQAINLANECYPLHR